MYQFVITRTRSGDYKIAVQVLKESMVQIDIDLFVNIKVISVLIQKVLPSIKNVDRHITNNLRIRTRKRGKKLDIYFTLLI